MPNIRHELLIGASDDIVYNAITSHEGLSGWWTPNSSAKPELNSVARFPFGSKYFKEMKITELIPSSKVTWICITGAEEWIGTTISFELLSGDKKVLLNTHPELADQFQQHIDLTKGTVLSFHHDGWKEDTPMFAECNYTWGQFLLSLKLLCETGKGRPWPNQHNINP